MNCCNSRGVSGRCQKSKLWGENEEVIATILEKSEHF